MSSTELPWGSPRVLHKLIEFICKQRGQMGALFLGSVAPGPTVNCHAVTSPLLFSSKLNLHSPRTGVIHVLTR